MSIEYDGQGVITGIDIPLLLAPDAGTAVASSDDSANAALVSPGQSMAIAPATNLQFSMPGESTPTEAPEPKSLGSQIVVGIIIAVIVNRLLR